MTAQVMMLMGMTATRRGRARRVLMAATATLAAMMVWQGVRVDMGQGKGVDVARTPPRMAATHPW